MAHTPSIEEGAVPPTWDLGDFTLRPLALGDEVAWAAYLSDPRVTRHTTFGDVHIGADSAGRLRPVRRRTC